MPADRRHRDGLADLGVGRTIELGCGCMEVDAIGARYLGGDGQTDQLLFLSGQGSFRIELHRLEFGPGAPDAFLRKQLEESRDAAERCLDVPIGRSRIRSAPYYAADFRDQQATEKYRVVTENRNAGTNRHVRYIGPYLGRC